MKIVSPGDSDARTYYRPGDPGFHGSTFSRSEKTLDNDLLAAVHAKLANEVARLLHLGANPNKQDQEGMTSLHHAAATGARPIIRILVASGKCDYLLQDNYGRYASHLAIEWARDYAVARLLTKKRMQQVSRTLAPKSISHETKAPR